MSMSVTSTAAKYFATWLFILDFTELNSLEFGSSNKNFINLRIKQSILGTKFG